MNETIELEPKINTQYNKLSTELCSCVLKHIDILDTDMALYIDVPQLVSWFRANVSKDHATNMFKDRIIMHATLGYENYSSHIVRQTTPCKQ